MYSGVGLGLKYLSFVLMWLPAPPTVVCLCSLSPQTGLSGSRHEPRELTKLAC